MKRISMIQLALFLSLAPIAFLSASGDAWPVARRFDGELELPCRMA